MPTGEAHKKPGGTCGKEQPRHRCKHEKKTSLLMGDYSEECEDAPQKPLPTFEKGEGKRSPEKCRKRLPVHRRKAIVVSRSQREEEKCDDTHCSPPLPPDDRTGTSREKDGKEIPHPSKEPIHRDAETEKNGGKKEEPRRMLLCPRWKIRKREWGERFAVPKE